MAQQRSTSYVALLLVLLLVACQPPAPITTNYNTGSEGITLSFSQGTPDKEVYEDSTIPVFVKLENKGAWDVRFDDLFFTVSGDKYYVSVEVPPEDAFGAQARGVHRPKANTDPYGDFLNGKSFSYPSGEVYEARSFVTFKRVPGLRQHPTTQIFARICYPYRTTFTTDICVDLNSFNQNVQEQICEATDLNFEDQGAPVAVVAVENRPVPRRVTDSSGASYQGVQQVFNIRIENVGHGAVLRPVHDVEFTDGIPALREENISAEERIAACNQDIPPTLLNAVGIEADLSGTPLECSPSIVQLRGGEGFTRCILPEKDSLTLTGPNYKGILNVYLDYLYTESIATDVTIIRQPFAPTTGGTASTNPAMVGEGPGARPRCDFCSANRNADECEGWTGSRDPSVTYSCSCSQEECFSRSGEWACVYGRKWCPGANYCCPKIPSQSS